MTEITATHFWWGLTAVIWVNVILSCDNAVVIALAVAAAAQGSIPLLVAGLAISMPFVIVSATVLVRLMERYPFIIVLGAGILGWVAGGMLVTDPAAADWIAANLRWMHIRPLGANWAEIAGALLVVGAGKWLARRGRAAQEHVLRG